MRLEVVHAGVPVHAPHLERHVVRARGQELALGVPLDGVDLVGVALGCNSIDIWNLEWGLGFQLGTNWVYNKSWVNGAMDNSSKLFISCWLERNKLVSRMVNLHG